ncbi:MAG: MFS transporter [Promethearchaeota archaeon]
MDTNTETAGTGTAVPRAGSQETPGPAGKRVKVLPLMVPAVGNSTIWGALAFIQFHARLPVAEGGFGLSELEVGIVWGLSALVSAIASPLWGAASDHTRTRWGKRKPYMVVLPVVTAFLLWVTASVDSLFGLSGVFWALFLAFTAYRVAHAGANIPYSTVILEIVPPQERVSVSQLSALMNGVGMALGAVVPTILFGVFTGFSSPFLVLGAALVACYYVTLPLIPASKYDAGAGNILQSIRTTFGDRNFMKFELAQFLWSVGLNMVLFVLPFLAQDLLHVREEATYGLLFVTFLGIAGVFLFLSGWVVERFEVEKKRALQFSLAFTCVALPFLGVIGSPLLAGTSVLGQVYVLGSLAFLGLIGLMVFPYAILMALVDRERGSESTYNGVNGFILGLAVIPAGPLGGYLLYRFGYAWIGAFCALFVLAAAIIFSRVHVPEHLFREGGALPSSGDDSSAVGDGDGSLDGTLDGTAGGPVAGAGVDPK